MANRGTGLKDEDRNEADEKESVRAETGEGFSPPCRGGRSCLPALLPLRKGSKELVPAPGGPFLPRSARVCRQRP